MPLAFPRRALAGMASGVAAACLALTGTAAGADQVRDGEWWLQALHVTQAWQSSRGSGVVVAVLDTGVDPEQADLKGSVRSGPDYTASGRVPGGPYWGIHGTAVASLIAGHGHGAGDSDGIMGIAPAATILSVRVTLESNDPLLANPTIAGALPAAIARGIRYAVKHRASVIDLPLDPVTTPGAAGAGGSAAERSAVRYALRHRVVLVAPAGDNGAGPDPANYPAAYRGVVSVGAFNSEFVRAPYSSHQPYVTLTAAGDGVIAASPPSGYAEMFSTSAASAMVAGIAALIRAQFPHMSPAKVTKALIEGTVFHRPSQRLHGSGYGTADAAQALAAAARIEEAVPGQGQSAGPAQTPAQAAPTPPAIHPASRSVGQMLRADAGIAIAVFIALLLAIAGFGWLRRRRARAVKLAEVRAASRLPVPMPRPAAPGAGAGAVGAMAGAAQRRDASGAGFRDAPAATGMAPWEIDSAEPGAAGFRGADFSRSIGGGPVPAPRTAPGGASAFGAGNALGARNALGTPEERSRPGDPAPAGRAAADRASSFAGPAPLARGAALSRAALADEPGEPAGNDADGAFAGRLGSSVPGGEPGGGGGLAAAGPGRALSGSRIIPPRTPRVSGSPPWEPASQPDGEVPWGRPAESGDSASADDGPAALPRRTRRQSAMSVWDAIAEEAWPGGPQADRKPAQPGSRAAGAQAADRDGDPLPDQQEAVARPVYVWNPGATTDKLPAIRPDSGSGQSPGATRI